MIATKIGKTFLKAYNQKYDKEYSAKDFFVEVYWELFYNHSKYMQWVTNSPFVQMKKGQKPYLLTEDERKEKLENLNYKIEVGLRDASIVIGYPASEEKEFATTSGLVTDIDLNISAEDVYYSWIGGSLGIGVAGGLSILFDYPDILLATFEGWNKYRKFLNDQSIEKLAGNKIISWNGQWLNFYFSDDYFDNPNFSELSDQKFFSEGKGNGKGRIVIETVKWSKLFFNLSRKLTHKTLTGYVYSLGQTNKTIGFIPFKFSDAQNISQVYKKLFGEFDAIEQQKDYENLMGIHIKRACELGSIGFQALEPKDLRKYFNNDKNIRFTQSTKMKKNESEEDFVFRERKVKKKQYEELITFRTYKTWLITMITKNKEEVLDYTSEIAKKLSEFRASNKKGSTKYGNIVNELFKSSNKKLFLSNLTEILKLEKDENIEYIKELRDRIHLMNNEDFGYFVTLLKFDYAFQQKEN